MDKRVIGLALLMFLICVGAVLFRMWMGIGPFDNKYTLAQRDPMLLVQIMMLMVGIMAVLYAMIIVLRARKKA